MPVADGSVQVACPVSIAVLRVVAENLPNFHALAKDASKAVPSPPFVYETCSKYMHICAAHRVHAIARRWEFVSTRLFHNGATTASLRLRRLRSTVGNFVTSTSVTAINS